MSEPFIAPNHPLTKDLLDRFLPDKDVKDFSLNFKMDGVSTLTAEIILSEEDAAYIMGVVKKYELEVKDEGTIIDPAKKHLFAKVE